MRRENLSFIVFIVALIWIGWTIGQGIARHPNLETFKLMNIIGLIYDLLGLIVLSEMVASSARWKFFIINWAAVGFLWGQTVIPLSAAIGAWALSDAPSAAKAASFFGLLWVYSMMPLAILDATVTFPRTVKFQNTEQRIRRLGLGLIVSGALVQLVAAYMDLNA